MDKNPVTWIEISRGAIKNNINQFNKILPRETKFMAVIKSNAYGHGLIEVAKIAKQAGVPWLGTVNLDEALLLRKYGIKGRILVLSYFHPDRLTEAIKQNITLTVYSIGAAKEIDRLAQKNNIKAKIHVKIDTGTSRLGIMPNKAVGLIKQINQLENLETEGIFSHFADAENPNQSFTHTQINKFNQLLIKLIKEGINIKIPHLACSAAILLNKKSYHKLARIGISLYGLWSIEKDGKFVKKLHSHFNLKPALSWYTKIIQIKELPKNSYIGYGHTYRTTKKIKLALIPVGYWEGYDRKLSNIGEVLIRGQKCKIRGRICMNLTMVDVSSLKNVRAGDKVTLIGKEGKNSITADDIANKIKTINYEVVTRINPQIKRIYN